MPKKGESKYSYESLAATARRYTVLKEFRENERKAYDQISRRGLIDELCGHMLRENVTNEELAAIALQYNSVKEFRANNKKAYTMICKRGLLGDYCKHMKRYGYYIHTEEELAEIASRYTTIKEFKKNECNIYDQIRSRGLLDKLCGNMKRERPEPLSDDDLAAVAKRYNNLTLFRKEQKRIYAALQRRGLIEEYCGHMERKRTDWTDKELKALALKYKTKKDFRRNHGGAYLAASKRGILEDICRHMKRHSASNDYYTKENCRAIAINYKTRAEFQSGNRRVYSAAKRNGWLDDICGHMLPAGAGRKRKVYVYTFDDGYAYVGLTDDTDRRKREHLSNFKENKKSPVFKHLQATGSKLTYKELTDWLDLDVVGKVEDDYIRQYTADGWKMLNRRGGGSLGGRGGLYAPDRMRKVIAGYEYAEDFKEKNQGLYDYLCENHLYSKYCAGLKHRRKGPNYWTMEKSVAVIPECETRTVFQKRYYQAYKLIKEAGLLDKYFPPVEMPKRKWDINSSAKVASLCRTRMELHKKYPGAYNALRKAGLLDKLMPLHKFWEKYNDEEKIKIIARCKTKRELHDNFRQVYEWLRLAGRLDEFYPKRISRK